MDIVRCEPQPALAPPPQAPSNLRLFPRCALTGHWAESPGWGVWSIRVLGWGSKRWSTNVHFISASFLWVSVAFPSHLDFYRFLQVVFSLSTIFLHLSTKFLWNFNPFSIFPSPFALCSPCQAKRWARCSSGRWTAWRSSGRPWGESYPKRCSASGGLAVWFWVWDTRWFGSFWFVFGLWFWFVCVSCFLLFCCLFVGWFVGWLFFWLFF